MKLGDAFRRTALIVLAVAFVVRGGALTAEERSERDLRDEKPAEETLYGTLEKTAHENACAQITDALGDVYYVLRTPEAVESCKAWFGKTVSLVGTAERHADGSVLLFRLKSVQAWTPKPPPER